MKKKLNVAILIDAWLPFMGGAQKQVLETTKIWKKKSQFKFQIFHSLGTNIFLRFLWLLYVIPQVLFFHFFKEQFTIIHAHAFLAGLPAKLLSVVLRIPVVFTIHGTGVGTWQAMQPGFLSICKEKLEEFILFKIKYTAQISVSSDILTQRLQSACAAAPTYVGVAQPRVKRRRHHVGEASMFPNINKNIFVIPNGVNIKSFDKVKIKKAAGFKILFVGRLHPQKGLIYLIKAMKKIVKEHPEAYLHIIGKGPEEQFLKKQIKNLGLEENIKFKGQLTGQALIKAYKSSHLFVLPSLYEGQPLTLLEAWAAKLPVMTTRVGESPKMIKEGVNGYLVKAGDSPQLARKLTKTIEDAGLAKLGENGYRLVRKKLSWLKASNKTIKVYQKVLGL